MSGGGQTISAYINGYVPHKHIGGPSQISQIYGSGVSGFGAGTLPRHKLVRKNESVGAPARALVQFQNTVSVSMGISQIITVSGTIPVGRTITWIIDFQNCAVRYSGNVTSR